MRYVGTVLGLVVAASVSAGPDWTEIPDARKIPPVQVIPFSPVASITGELIGLDAAGGPDVADLYQVSTTVPGTKVSTGPGGPLREANFDTLLVLFATDGRAIVANDDVAPGQTHSELIIPSVGTFFLGVAAKGTQPVSNGGNIFNFAAPGAQFAQLTPNGPGATQPVINWNGSPVDPEPRNYLARFDNSPNIPTMSEWGLIGLGGVIIAGALVVLRKGPIVG